MLPAVPPPCFSLRWFTEDGGLDPAGGAEQGPQASQDTPREGLCSEGSLPLVLGMEEEGGSWRGGSRGDLHFLSFSWRNPVTRGPGVWSSWSVTFSFHLK